MRGSSAVTTCALSARRRAPRLAAPTSVASSEGRRAHQPAAAYVPVALTDAPVRRYMLRFSGTTLELRWIAHARPRVARLAPVAPREVVGALESYEPVCALTRAAVARFRDAIARVSVATLSVELRRVESSPIVLNRKPTRGGARGGRERGVSLSAIAMACGRVKYDRRGNHSGETSWLARRVGLLPSAPTRVPTPGFTAPRSR